MLNRLVRGRLSFPKKSNYALPEHFDPSHAATVIRTSKYFDASLTSKTSPLGFEGVSDDVCEPLLFGAISFTDARSVEQELNNKIEKDKMTVKNNKSFMSKLLFTRWVLCEMAFAAIKLCLGGADRGRPNKIMTKRRRFFAIQLEKSS